MKSINIFNLIYKPFSVMYKTRKRRNRKKPHKSSLDNVNNKNNFYASLNESIEQAKRIVFNVFFFHFLYNTILLFQERYKHIEE